MTPPRHGRRVTQPRKNILPDLCTVCLSIKLALPSRVPAFYQKLEIAETETVAFGIRPQKDRKYAMRQSLGPLLVWEGQILRTKLAPDLMA